MNIESMRNVEKSIGESISAVRKMKKLTQKAFAEKLTDQGLSVDASAISRMEKGERALRIAECLVVAEVLEVDLSFLLRGIQTPAQELKEIREFADFSMRSMAEPFHDWLTNLLHVKWGLENDHELVSGVAEELHSPADYLPWVASRISELKWTYDYDSAESHVMARDQSEVDLLISCVTAYATSRITADEGPDNGVDSEAS